MSMACNSWICAVQVAHLCDASITSQMHPLGAAHRTRQPTAFVPLSRLCSVWLALCAAGALQAHHQPVVPR
jgi:hypothetical protein